MTLKGMKKRIGLFLTNHLFAGTRCFEIKRHLLKFAGFRIGERTKIVGPVFITGNLTVGEDCWIGCDLKVHGNGHVVIGKNCDLAPDISFLTGSHKIGSHERRAGEGFNSDITVGDGCWIGAGAGIMPGVQIGDGCIVAAHACVTENVPNDTLTGGVPSRVIRKLE